MPAVAFSNVSVAYGPTPVLRNVSLDLPARQTHVVLGPSGSGKSTLLKCLTGLLIPTEGTVTVFGRRVVSATLPAQRLANREAGLVIQDGGLFPHLTVADNVTLPARLAGWPDRRIAARLDELETFVGLAGDLRLRFPRALSGGQRQRVAIARALLLDPPLLLLDEPLSALDPMIRTELQDQLKEIFEAVGKTVVMVTHDIPEALHFADTIALLENGTLVQHGPPDQILRRPASDWAKLFVRASVPRWRELARSLQALGETL